MSINIVKKLQCWANIQLHKYSYIFISEGIEVAKLTYLELDRRARIIGNLLKTNRKKSFSALLLYSSGLEYVEAFFGCLYAGIIAIPSYPPKNNRLDARLHAIVNDSKANLILTTSKILKDLKKRNDYFEKNCNLCIIATDEIENEYIIKWSVPDVSNDSLAFLQYTSGSTSAPKGVMVTHGNIIHNQQMIQEAFGHTAESIVAGWLPIFHDMGLIGNILQPLYLGATCYLMSPTDFLRNPFNWLKLISDTQATTSGGPDFAYELCVRKITQEQKKQLDLSHWRIAFNGSEPVRAQTIERFSKAFTSCGFKSEAFYPCYGLAEATLFVSGRKNASSSIKVAKFQVDALTHNQVKTASSDDIDSQKLVSSGCAWLDEEILIVNPDTKIRSSSNEIGEIWIKGPNIAKGYWNKPEVSEEIFQARTADTDDGPFLRTGDLGFLKNGELFVTGRLKDLLIIRGRNYYPQDIELTVESAHKSLQVAGCAAFAIELEDEERLVIVCEVQRTCRNVNVEDVAKVVRQAVSESHELLVHSFVLLRPMSIPKTSSGKIQRHLCRTRFLDGTLEVIGNSVQTMTSESKKPEMISRIELMSLNNAERFTYLKEYLCQLMCHLLHISTIDTEQPLVALGIDSLLAVEMQNNITIGLSVNIPSTEFIEGINIVQLTKRILTHIEMKSEEPSHENTIIPQNLNGQWPLSFEQERMVMLEQISPGNTAFHIPYALYLFGLIDIGILEQCLNKIISRHSVLRATFRWVQGRSQQIIIPNIKIMITKIACYLYTKEEKDSRIQEEMIKFIRKPFDISNGPLLRVALFCIGRRENILLLTVHHIVADISSIAIIIRELALFYNSCLTNKTVLLPELPIQYGDFVHWQRLQFTEELLSDHLMFWKEHLAGLSWEAWLPTDEPRRAKLNRSSVEYNFALSRETVASLHLFCQKEHVTLFCTLLACFYTLLNRYSGKNDFCVGAPTQGRMCPETRDLIGFFAYPLALRLKLTGDPTFRELVEMVRIILRDASTHQQVPFSQVVRAVIQERSGKRAQLFPVMFSLVKSPLKDVLITGLDIKSIPVEGAVTDFDWFLTAIEETNGTLSIQWIYNNELYFSSTIVGLSRVFIGLIKFFLEKPDSTISKFNWPDTFIQKKNAEHNIIEKSINIPRTKMVITASFTAEPLADSLYYWTKKLNLSLDIVFAPYNQIFQQLLDPASQLNKNERGANIVLLRFEDWLRYDSKFKPQNGISKTNFTTLKENLNEFIITLKNSAKQSKLPYIVVICSPSSILSKNFTFLSFLQYAHTKQKEIRLIDNVSLITSEEIQLHYSVENYEDEITNREGHIPYTKLYYTAIGTMVMRMYHVFHRPPFKVIILDCDNTLWKGICGEDGWNGIELTPQHKALQEFMLVQQGCGMLLCLCSKNNEKDVWDVFEHRDDMPIKRSHLTTWRLNWQAKSENIQSIAEELRLGMDSFIFVDDNPLECAEVRAHCPQVAALQLPKNRDKIPSFLYSIWEFDHGKVTDDDRIRSDYYRQNNKREKIKKETATLDDFLENLDLRIKINAITEIQIDRVAQLTQRTNQFNTTMIRRSAQEIAMLVQTGKVKCLTVQVSDRFGDYGLVGVILYEYLQDCLWIDSLMLSCRVLGRKVEHSIVEKMGDIARTNDMRWVVIPYVSSHRNNPVLDFLNSFDSKFREVTRDGFCFRIQVDRLAGIGSVNSFHKERTSNCV